MTSTEGPQADDAGETASRWRFGSRAILVFGVAFLAAVLFGVVALLVTAKSTPLLRLDRDTADGLHRFALRHRTFTTAMRAISDSGSSVVWWCVFALVIAWALYRRRPRLAIFVVVTGVGSSLLNNLIKLAVDRTRPHLLDPVAVAAGKSFPSGHSQAAIVGYGILLAVFLPVVPRRWRPWAMAVAALMVLLIGFSRIALGVHYLSDVVGAYLVGTVWLLGLVSACRAWRREEGKPEGGLVEGLEPEQGNHIAS
jgi:membrane-associated phospholipid phosphatase